MPRHNQPDDYFNNGIFEMARFGERIIMRNNMTPSEFQEIEDAYANNYESKKNEIASKVAEIRNKIAECDPLMLLQYARDMVMLSQINKYSEIEYSTKDNLACRRLEYIQSVITSTGIIGFIPNDSTEQQNHMTDILNLVDELYDEFIYFYNYWSAYVQKTNPVEKQLLEFIVESQMLYWVRGNRYQAFELEYLKTLLPPHNQILVELFNTSAQQIIDGLGKMEYALSQERADMWMAMGVEFDKFQSAVESGVDSELAIIASQEIVGPIIEKALGVGLNDVASITNWDTKLIKALTYRIGECSDFYGKVEFSGWPILSLPISRKPFIELNGISFCFSYYALFDNFYRIIQKEITALLPEYKEKWKAYQTRASEDMVEEIFKRLLPGAQTFNNNYYPEGKSLKQLSENDLLVLYDDALLIVEIKAGSFPQTPPLIDYEAHISAYKTLVEKADHQCSRTLQYIDDKQDAVFYTIDKQEKITIHRNDIREIYTFSITIDNFNEFATRAEKLSFLALKSNSITMSYDDLLTYSEYFDSPLYFLHFLKQRKLATAIKQISLRDELDHLGMYIKHNMYSITASKMPEENRIFWHGFREALDNYFCRLYIPDIAIEKPVQEIPALITEIIKVMLAREFKQKLYLSSFLLDFSDDARTEFVNGVQNIFTRQMKSKHMLPMLAFGEIRYCVFINIDGSSDMNYSDRYDYIYATAMRNAERSITWIDLFVDKSCKILDVAGQECFCADIKSEDYSRLHSLSLRYAKSRIEARKRHAPKHKIGRNEFCPCGSEKKYKQCCINLEV